MNLDLNWNVHVALRLNHDNVRTCFDPPIGIFGGIILWSQRIHAFVPKIKLVIVGKDLDGFMLKPHTGTCLANDPGERAGG